MAFEQLIAFRYLRPVKGQSFISVIGLISVLGITVGVAAIIMVLSVLNGFEHEVKSRFIGFDSHLKVLHKNEEGFLWSDSLERTIRTEPGVRHLSPFIIEKGMISASKGQRVAFIKGVDRDRILEVTDLEKNRAAGDFHFGGGDNLRGIWLGFNLALEIEATVGDTVTVISPSGVISPFSVPQAKRFRITAVYKTDMFEYDNAYAFIDRNDAASLFEREDKIDGVDLKLKDIGDSWTAQKNMTARLGENFRADTWYDLHADLYSAMKVEKWGSMVLLSLIITVAGFNIISTLIMLVMQKTPEIGILRAMGAPAPVISGIFIRQGLWVGCFGILLGCLIGYGICFLQIQYGMIPLPSGVFFIEAVPVKLKWIDFFMVLFVSFSLILVSTFYPARKAAGLVPVEALRSKQ